MHQSIETLARAPQVAATFAVEFAPRLLAAALVPVVGWFATGWALRILPKALARFELEPPLRLLVERILRGLMIALPQHRVRLPPSAGSLSVSP